MTLPWIALSICIPFSKAGVSISLTFIVAISLILFFKNEGRFHYYNSFFLLFAILFGLCFFSGLWSNNTISWLNQIWLKAPFICFAFLCGVYQNINWKWVFIAFIVSLFIVSIIIIFNVFNNSTLLKSMSLGKHGFTPIPSIQFSVLLSLAFLLNVNTMAQKSYTSILFYVSSCLSIFFLFLIIAMGFRLAILICFISGASLLILSEKILFKHLLIPGFLGVSILILSYYSIDSFHQKIHYSLYDIQQIKAGNGANYSDGERLISWKLGMKAFFEKPFLGHGDGDLWDTMNRLYQTYSPESIKIIIPHNQWITWLVTYGHIGFFLISIGLFKILNTIHAISFPFFLAWFLYSLVENPFEELIPMVVFGLVCVYFNKNISNKSFGQ